MKARIDEPDAIVSTCDAPPLDAEGPTDERCNREATTYVSLPSGVRRYICADHAAQVDRFDADTDDHPTVAVCEACQKVSPTDRITFDGRCADCSV